MFFGRDERELAWRDEVRSFIATITEEDRDQFRREMRELEVERHAPSFFARLCERGWVGLQFPEPWGRGAPDTERFILHEELAAAGLGLLYGVEISEAIGWMLVRNGPEALAAEHLPKIVDGSWSYAAGYSEPEAGSDLLNIRSRARQEGDDWIIDGAKMWTSAAHVADFIFAVVRTEEGSQRHHGLSIVLVPTDADGVEVNPVPVLGGWRVNACFFDSVRVPVANTVGEPGRGWNVLSEALNTERAMSFGGRESRLLLDRLETWLAAQGRELGAADRERLFEFRTELEAERLLVLRAAAMASRGVVADAEASMGKLVGSETAQRVAEWAVDVVGGSTVFGDTDLLGPVGSIAHDDPFVADVEEFLRVATVLTVIGGTSEVQRNVIARRRLALPRS